MNVLNVTGLTKAYGGRTIFDGVSFAIDEGEKVGFIGVNGSGKSTLFRIVSGAEGPDAGEIALRRNASVRHLAQEPEYTPVGTEGAEIVRMRVGHHIADLPGREMRERRAGVLGITIRPEGDMANSHVMEWEVREYQRQNSVSPMHRHPWETVYHIMDGEGYAILQRDGEQKRRVNWKKGDLFVVEANEYHDNGARVGSAPKSPFPRLMQMRPSGYFFGVGNVGKEDHSPVSLSD